MASYSELEKLPASAYLNPDNFRTLFDNPPSAVRQYHKGLKISQESRSISIGYNSVWGATALDGASVSSYEGIGYHANTAALLQGFLDGPAPITVYRRHQAPTVIKEDTRAKHDVDYRLSQAI